MAAKVRSGSCFAGLADGCDGVAGGDRVGWDRAADNAVGSKDAPFTYFRSSENRNRGANPDIVPDGDRKLLRKALVNHWGVGGFGAVIRSADDIAVGRDGHAIANANVAFSHGLDEAVGSDARLAADGDPAAFQGDNCAPGYEGLGADGDAGGVRGAFGVENAVVIENHLLSNLNEAWVAKGDAGSPDDFFPGGSE